MNFQRVQSKYPISLLLNPPIHPKNPSDLYAGARKWHNSGQAPAGLPKTGGSLQRGALVPSAQRLPKSGLDPLPHSRGVEHPARGWDVWTWVLGLRSAPEEG